MRRAWAIALLFPLQLAAQQDAPARVTGLRVVPGGGATEVVIETSGATPGWRAFVLENPARVVLDLEDARIQLPASRFDQVDRGGVSAIRASQFSPSVARVAIDLDRAAPYTVSQERDGIHVRINMTCGTTAVLLGGYGCSCESPPGCKKFGGGHAVAVGVDRPA